MVICLRADGASVMSVEFSGFAELLRSDYFHWLLCIHCTAHRINLSVSDLIKGSNLALDIFSTNDLLHTLLNHGKVRVMYTASSTLIYKLNIFPSRSTYIGAASLRQSSLKPTKTSRYFRNFDHSYANPRGHDPKHVEQAGGFTIS